MPPPTIVAPLTGTRIALDPDIPLEDQGVTLQLSGMPGAGWRWRIDDTPLVAAGGETLWRQRPGRHALRACENILLFENLEVAGRYNSYVII